MKNRRIVEVVKADGSGEFHIEYKILGWFWIKEFPHTRTFPDFSTANDTAKHEYKAKTKIHEVTDEK